MPFFPRALLFFPFFVAFSSAYASAEPLLRLENFFVGHTRSSGSFQNTVGKPQERFTTDCYGRMRGRTLLLDQRFRYDDGRTQERHWQIRPTDATHYVGRANDIVGEARGEAFGSSVHLRYTVAIKPGNPLFNIQLEQTMTLRRDGTLENRATIHKLGVLLSRISERFHRAN